MVRPLRTREKPDSRGSRRTIYDVIVVGAGPGGASAATFLARRGISTLLLDRCEFPREKVCGDGLTPQAIYWLDRLGCVDEVLAAANACIKSCDLYINGEYLLTGGFPNDTIYPDFATILDRPRFDHILLRNAVKAGARFEPRRIVRDVERVGDCMRVTADVDGERVEYRGRIVIGADGATSAVSRSIGNVLKDGATVVSLRTYYQGVRCNGSQIKVYFDRKFFPGYAWVFVDDSGFANVGLGYAFDKSFAPLPGLRRVFERFVDTGLKEVLAGATRRGAVSGGVASFYRPRSIVADGVMLVGDAANHTDPLNGGGIHKAMESAFFASEAAAHALSVGDFSCGTLGLYPELWRRHFDVDWRTANLCLSIAMNPTFKDVWLFLVTQIGRLTARDRQFRDFASGIFSGVISRSVCLSPLALYHAFPKEPGAWLALVENRKGLAAGSARLAMTALQAFTAAAGPMALSPLQHLGWGIEVATKMVQLAEQQVLAVVGFVPTGNGVPAGSRTGTLRTPTEVTNGDNDTWVRQAAHS